MFFTCRRSADVVMVEDLEMGGSRPSRRWRAKGHCREVTISKGVALCSQQGSCVLGFHMGLGKRGSGAQAGIMAHLSGPTQPATKGLA